MCTFILSKIILKNLNLQEWDNISLKKEIALSRGLSSNALMVNFETDRNNIDSAYPAIFTKLLVLNMFKV